jgi:hypothetical protein
MTSLMPLLLLFIRTAATVVFMIVIVVFFIITIERISTRTLMQFGHTVERRRFVLLGNVLYLDQQIFDQCVTNRVRAVRGLSYVRLQGF